MPVKMRGSSFEATVHYKGDRHRKSFPTKIQAEAWELHTKADLKQGKIIQEGNGGSNHESGPKDLLELLDITHKAVWRGKNSESTSLLNANKCINTIGVDMHPSKVDRTVIDNMIFKFEAEGIAPATINRRLSALSRMLTYAFECDFLVKVPKFQRKPEPDHHVRYFTEAEEAELLACFKFLGNHDMVDLCMLAIDTGMRLGEIRRLAPQYVSHQDNLITIHESKSGKVRYIPMTKRVATLLASREMALEDRTTPFWKGWTNSKIHHIWNHGRSHMNMMGDPQFVSHTMRHTFCSRLVQRGVDIVSVCQLAGHSSITMTMRYSHLKPDNLADAIKALEPPKQLRA